MLLGGSKVEQLLANIAAVAKGPLPADVTAACTPSPDLKADKT